MSRTQFAALMLAATALAASGCGGSSKTSSTASTPAASTPSTTAAATHPTGPSLTRAALIAKGDAICARENAKTVVLSSSTIKGLARIYPQVAIYNRTEAAELSRLVPPSSMAGDWARMIQDLEAHSRYDIEIAHDISAHNEHAAAHPFALANAALSDLIATGRRNGFARCSHLN